MFKKKNKTAGSEDNDCRTVVTETVKTADGVIQTTRTTVSSSGSRDKIEEAFKDFDSDHSLITGKRHITKKVIYTSSNGEVTEEEITETVSEKPAKEIKSSKPLAEKLGFKSTVKNKDDQKSESKSPACMKTGKFEEDCLKSHNSYRAKHGVPNLKLSKQLCSYSKEWADHLATTDTFQHRTERKYGENIFMKWSSDPTHTVTGYEAVDSWYSEIKDHNFGKEPTSLKSGHFTQVLWKESTELGVAWARSKTGKILVVANYNPPGNFVGKFSINVPPPKK